MVGPDTQNWKRRLIALAQEVGIEEQIVWAGSLTGDVKWGAFRAADALIHPSHHENFGMVVAEALACGLPVLITNKVNIWREITTDGAGLVGPDTVTGVRILLEQWLTLSAADKDLMRSRGRSSFVNRFEISRTARSLLGVLEAALAA
jgi:glycosyltransferase involved in cell wall biosynthesis